MGRVAVRGSLPPSHTVAGVTLLVVPDRIILTGLRAFGRHGVFPEEKEVGQDFVVDAILEVETKAAAASDDLADTVHYGLVADLIVEIIGGPAHDLIETVANRVADAILTEFPLVRAVAITLHKPSAPIAHQFTDVAVRVEREQ